MNRIELCEIATIFNGKTPAKNEQREHGHPVLKIRDVDESLKFKGKFESFVDKELALKNSQKQLIVGDTLILNAAHNADYVGSKTYYVEPSAQGALATGEWLIIRPNINKVDPRFLRFWLTSKETKKEIRELVKGIHLYPKDVARLKITLPSIIEQKRVADILDRADELRAKRRKAFELVNSLTQSIFLEMFGDPVSNPYNFKVVKCEQICERITVGIVIKPASYYKPSGVIALRSLNIKPGYIDLNEVVYFSQTDCDTKLHKTRLNKGDVVLVRTGQPGTAAVIPSELDGVNAIDILITTPNKDLVIPEFLAFFLNSSAGKRIVMGEQRGQVQKHLNVGSLNDASIMLPPIELQFQFLDRLKKCEAIKNKFDEHNSLLNQLFISTQHFAFTGEL